MHAESVYHEAVSREEYVADYLSNLSHFLGHHYWVFRVVPEYSAEGWAEVHIEDYNEATVTLSARFWDAPASTKTQVLLHELLHLSFIRQHEHLQDGVESILDWLPAGDKKKAKAQLEIHEKAAERAEEVEVNRLAVLLTEFAPQWDMQ